MAKVINTPTDLTAQPQKAPAGNQDTRNISGDYKVDSSPVIVGVKIAGTETLFDYLDSGLKD